ncbi:MAG: transposase [Verrucomicrobia bacterium]|nr:transposase [Verrucomicrobiota bacterium]
MEQPPRLHRLSHLCIRQPIYFLTACTHERQTLLANIATHDAFLQFARAAYERGVAVGRYVLMPDHLHVFASFAPDALALSEWMKALKGTLAKLWREQPCSGGLRPPVLDDNKFGGRRPPLQAGPYWQKGFFDHVIRSEESYSEKWRYVMESPVRKKLVTRAEDWPYAGEMHILRPETP